jgi:hypothetical protein
MVAGGVAGAEAPADSILRQLREQGYVEFSVDRTWLGRIQVIALAPDGTRREIVVSPNTGEILRDYIEASDGGSSTPRILDRPAGGSDRDAPVGGASEENRDVGQGNGNDRGQGQGNDRGQGDESGRSQGNGRGQGDESGRGQGQGNGGAQGGGNQGNGHGGGQGNGGPPGGGNQGNGRGGGPGKGE